MAGLAPGCLTAGYTLATAFCQLKKSDRRKLSVVDAGVISVIRTCRLASPLRFGFYVVLWCPAVVRRNE